MVTDYRGLNACILDSAYFTADSRFSLEQIADNCVFSEFDCVDGFWNVCIDKRDQKYLATTIERIGLVRYTVLRTEDFVIGIPARDGRYLFRNRRRPGNAL